MESKDKKYFRDKLLALRNAIDTTLEEIGEVEAPAPPRKRRNLKEARVLQMETDYAAGTWRKPKHLRKSK